MDNSSATTRAFVLMLILLMMIQGSSQSDKDEVVPATKGVDVPVSSPHHYRVSNATLGICVTLLIILIIGVMYKCWKKQNPHGEIGQHRLQADQVEDLEGSITDDGNEQTAHNLVNGQAKAGELARTENQPCGQLSCSSGVLSHDGSAVSDSRSSANLLGRTSYSDPHLSHGHLPSDAIVPVDDERDEMITTPINTAAHSSTSCSDYNSDAVDATPSEVLPERRSDFQIGGEPLVIPAKQESFSGKNLISPGSLPGKASNVDTRHPTTEGPKKGVDSLPSMVTSADPLATLRVENEIDTDKVSTCQAASALGVTDVARSCTSVVVDVTAASLNSPSAPADTHADAALAPMDDSSAASVNAVTSGAVAVTAISPNETDGAEIEETPNTAYGLIKKDTGACRESNRSSPLLKATTQTKACKNSKVSVVPSNPDSSNGNKHCSCHGKCTIININVTGKSNTVYAFGDNSSVNAGYSSTDTAESKE